MPIWRPRVVARSHRRLSLAATSAVLAVTLVAAPVVGGVSMASARSGRTAPGVVNGCWSSDNGYPVLTRLTVSPRTVEQGQTFTITASAHDVGGPGPATGISSVEVDYPDIGGGIMLARQADGTYVGRASFARVDTTLGPHSAWYAMVTDRAGNRHQIPENELASQGFDTTVDVVPSTAETTPPLVSHVSIPTRADGRHGGRITVTARVTDTGSGVASVVFDLLIPRGDSTDRYRRMRLVPGTTDTYRGSFRLPHWGGTAVSTYRLQYIYATDRAGNHELKQENKAIQVRRRPDTTKPRLVGHLWIRGGARTLDLRTHARTVTLMGRFTDTGSGVRYVGLHAWHTGLSGFGDLHALGPATRVAGNRYHGTWAQRFRARPCDAAGNGVWLFAPQVFMDAVHMVGRFTEGDVLRGGKILADDHIPPRYGFRSSGGSIRFHFSESVRGLTGASALVTDPDDNPVPGTWTCATAAGAAADCARGPLITAVFTPDTPGGGTSTARFRFNPDRHIDIVDLHRNPLLGHGQTDVRY